MISLTSSWRPHALSKGRYGEAEDPPAAAAAEEFEEDPFLQSIETRSLRIRKILFSN
jgi:hypothetical protein